MDLHVGSGGSGQRRGVDGFIRDMENELKKNGNEGHEDLVRARMPRIKNPPAIIKKLAKRGNWDHIFPHAPAAAST